MDSSIREQGYIYFLSEAPDLLQTIESELFSLAAERSPAKIHNLMRATHTLKGGAANVELEVINKIAHSLEDVFKALYDPNVEIDAQLQTLLFQAFECLQISLTSEITGTTVDNDDLMQRAATVFAQLQEKLGDAFGAEAHIPTSEELGFDIVLSIFETGVTQRIESIAETLKNTSENGEFKEFFTNQAEVFIGLAESLNLPGFEEIAQLTLTALQANPDQAIRIGEIVLADLQQAREAVLAGDRTRGGEPSQDLRRLAIDDVQDNSEAIFDTDAQVSLSDNLAQIYEFITQPPNNIQKPVKPAIAQLYLKLIRYILGWFNHELQIPEKKLDLYLLIPHSSVDNSVNYVENWLSEFIEFINEEEDSQSLCFYRLGAILTVLLSVAKFQFFTEAKSCDINIIEILKNRLNEVTELYTSLPPVTTAEKKWVDCAKLQKLLLFNDISAPPLAEIKDMIVETIWGNSEISFVEDELTDTANETIIQADEVSTESLNIDQNTVLSPNIINPVAIEPEQKPSTPVKIKPVSSIRVDVEGLAHLNYLAGELLIYQKRRTLQDEHLKEIITQLSQQLQRHQQTIEQLGELPLQMQTNHKSQQFSSVDFDALEMDEYTDFHLMLHATSSETLQMQETIESLDLMLQESVVIEDKKQRLASGIIDNLVAARMSPLGILLNRFEQMVQNLGHIHGKKVNLKLSGTQVLVDKAIAQKLYDPLLHLVRNAFDHGIEAPEIRRDCGKPEQGVIEICAYHQGSQTAIEVRDDGQGLNVAKIRLKAVELGLLSTGDNLNGDRSTLSTEEILEYLFTPGFSTAGKVSDISGRGIGLDIVRTQLQALNGSITVQSVPQQGTTFILKIPFSMTTDKLMIVQAGGDSYALLLNSIEKILIPTNEHIKQFEGKKVLYWNTGKDERMISLRQIGDLIYYNRASVTGVDINNSYLHQNTSQRKPVLLLRNNQELLGLEVDQIIGEQELVIRPLGGAIAPPKYIYGCSILANGNLVLVIDGTVLLAKSIPIRSAIDVMALPQADSQPKTWLMSSTIPSQALLTAPVSPDRNSKLVLVVDDAISLRQTLSLTLEKYGYQVLQAQNGVEALEQLQRHKDIGLVISDLEMPHMNGFELLYQLRVNSDISKVPVIIITSRSADKHRQLAENLGATGYLTKPYLEHEFLYQVERIARQSPFSA